MIHILYRISSNSYPKKRLEAATKIACLKNAIIHLLPFDEDIKFELFGDAVNEETQMEIDKVLERYPQINYHKINTGSGAASFNVTLTHALTLDEEDIVYFLEDDYIHLPGSDRTIKDIMEIGSDYGTLYLCPDKFIAPDKGGNPFVEEDGGYATKIYQGRTQLFAHFNSTTMTFFSKVKTLKRDEPILRKHTVGTHPQDFKMFLELQDQGCMLLCPLNTKSTHAEIAWLSHPDRYSTGQLPTFWSHQLK